MAILVAHYFVAEIIPLAADKLILNLLLTGILIFSTQLCSCPFGANP
jgi:hypothetical protein